MIKLFALITSAILAGQALAFDLQPGTYKGKDEEGDNFKMHVRDYPGRNTSFVAIIEREGKRPQAALYLVDPYAPGRYGMINWKAKSNYVIGAVSARPELSLNVTDKIMTISENGEGRSLGFYQAITFKMRNKKTAEWIDIMPGAYEDKTTLTPIDQNGDASLNNKSTDKNLRVGDYIVHESRPALYIALSSGLETDGIQKSTTASGIIYFSESTGIFGGIKMNVIDNSGFLSTIKKK